MNTTNNTKDIFDPRNLEKLLIKAWTEFIDARKLLNFLKINIKEKFHINNPKIQTLLVSNVILEPQGILLWINYNIMNSSNPVNITHEVLLKADGTIEITKTI
jgi:hypothetical protein